MRKSTAKKLMGLMLLLIVAIGGVFAIWGMQREKFVWDYMVTDDTSWRTMIDDGSSTNVYYQINFQDLKIRKLEDRYVGVLHTYDYRERVIYEQTMDDRTAEKFRTLLEKLWSTGDTQEGNYAFYTIDKDGEGARYIQSESKIAQIKVYTDIFDKRAES